MKEKLEKLDVRTLIELYGFFIRSNGGRNALALVEDVILEKTGFSR